MGSWDRKDWGDAGAGEREKASVPVVLPYLPKEASAEERGVLGFNYIAGETVQITR